MKKILGILLGIVMLIFVIPYGTKSVEAKNKLTLNSGSTSVILETKVSE